MTLAVGSTFSGKYQIQRKLGQGGMGTVYLARHLLLDRYVALKILRSDTAVHPNARERLVREGRALARLRGKHIARVLDVEAQDLGPCFLVLEYLEGEHLGQVLERSGPLPIAEAVGYVLDVCEALTEAHREGIIHRDIKPSNLFLTTFEDGSRGMKVIDFGISKYGERTESLTQSGAVVGSPCYMAPEQMRSSATVDARCDIWALGVVFYEMLVGKPPHSGANALEVCASILESIPPSPQACRKDIPLTIDRAVRRCLARNPEERFGSVSDLARALVPNSDSNGKRIALHWHDRVAPQFKHAKSCDFVELEPPETAKTTVTEIRRTLPPRRPYLTFATGLFILGFSVLILLLGRSHVPRSRQSTSAVASNRPTDRTLSQLPPTAPLATVRVAPTGSKPTVAPSGSATNATKPLSKSRASPRASSVTKATPTTVLQPNRANDPVLQYGRF